MDKSAHWQVTGRLVQLILLHNSTVPRASQSSVLLFTSISQTRAIIVFESSIRLAPLSPSPDKTADSRMEDPTRHVLPNHPELRSMLPTTLSLLMQSTRLSDRLLAYPLGGEDSSMLSQIGR